jgi:hypothetical protein
MDLEWKMGVGLAPDPEEGINKVQAARMQRMELVLGRQATVVLAAPKEEEDEEEEEEVDEGKEEESGGGDEGEEGRGEEGHEEEDEEQEEEKVQIKPLYEIAKPAQGIKLSIQQMWDNFAVKALKMTEEDDGTSRNNLFVISLAPFTCRILHAPCSQMMRRNERS